MKPSSIRSLMLVLALLTPLSKAQDASAKVREIEQAELRKNYQDAVRLLVGAAREAVDDEGGSGPEIIGRRLEWLTLVSNQIEPGGKTIHNEENTRNAGKLNDLAWSMITSSDAGKRNPNIALKLADIAIKLGGEDKDLKPKVLDTKARALFLLGKQGEAITTQEKAVAAATVGDEKAGMETTLAAYRKNELPEVFLPAGARETAKASDQSGTAGIANKLERIVIPSVDFEDTTLEEAVAFLRKRSLELDQKELDPGKAGLNFVIRRPSAKSAASPGSIAEPGALRIKSLHLRNVPFSIALRYICDVTGLIYRVDEFAVTLVQRSVLDEDFFTRTFQVPPDFYSMLNSTSKANSKTKDPFARKARPSITELLKANGIKFDEGSSATLNPDMLLITNTPTQLERIEVLIQMLNTTPPESWERVNKGFLNLVESDEKAVKEAIPATDGKKELPETSSPADGSAGSTGSTGEKYWKMNQVDVTDNTRRIMDKLDKIVIPAIDFEDAAVEEAVEFLRKKCAELDTAEPDPTRKGLNFIVRTPAAKPASASPSPSGKETLPIGELDSFRIKSLHLRNVPIGMALKYICDATGMRYKVDDFAVTLVARSEADKELFTRSFRVPPDFSSILYAGSLFADESAAANRPVLELLKANGIIFGEGSSATLTAAGVLWVTNTPNELNKLEQLIQAVAEPAEDQSEPAKSGSSTPFPEKSGER